MPVPTLQQLHLPGRQGLESGGEWVTPRALLPNRVSPRLTSSHRAGPGPRGLPHKPISAKLPPQRRATSSPQGHSSTDDGHLGFIYDNFLEHTHPI